MNENQDLAASLKALPTHQLEKRLNKLPKVVSNHRKKRFGNRERKKNADALKAQEERSIIQAILAERIEAEQVATKERLQHTLTEQALSHHRIGEITSFNETAATLGELAGTSEQLAAMQLYAQMEERGPVTSLTHEETTRLYQGASELSPLTPDDKLQGFSGSVTWKQFKSVGDLNNSWDTGCIEVQTLPPEKAEEVEMDHDLLELFQTTALVKQVPVTRKMACITHAIALEYLRTYVGRREGTPHAAPDADYLESEKIAKSFAMLSAQFVCNAMASRNGGKYVDTALQLGDSRFPHTKESLLESARNSPHSFLGGLIDKLDTEAFSISGEYGGYEPPKSIEEALERLKLHCFTILNTSIQSGSTLEDHALLSAEQIQELVPIAKLMMDRTPEYLGSENKEGNELLGILCPELLRDVEMNKRFILLNVGGRVFIAYTDNDLGQYIEQFDREDLIENRHSVTYPDIRVVESLFKTYKGHESGDYTSLNTIPLCTLAELEAHFFQSQDVEGRFLMDPNEEGSHTDEIDSLSTPQAGNDEEKPMRERLRTLRALLLRLGLNATFSWDE